MKEMKEFVSTGAIFLLRVDPDLEELDSPGMGGGAIGVSC